MTKLTPEVQKIMVERFEKDNIIALATVEDGTPHVRNVNAYYKDGCFYILLMDFQTKCAI